MTALPTLMRIAEATREGGDLRTTASIYRRAHALHPDEPAPLVGLGQVMAQAGAHEKAVEAYRDALTRDPLNEFALRGLGEALINLDQGVRALARFETLLEADPNDYRALNGKGIALDSIGSHAEAQAVYRAGIAIAPANISLRNNLGLSLAMSGQHNEGISLLRTLVGEAPASEQVKKNLAEALTLARRAKSAASLRAPEVPSEGLLAEAQRAALDQSNSDVPALSFVTSVETESLQRAAKYITRAPSTIARSVPRGSQPMNLLNPSFTKLSFVASVEKDALRQLAQSSAPVQPMIARPVPRKAEPPVGKDGVYLASIEADALESLVEFLAPAPRLHAAPKVSGSYRVQVATAGDVDGAFQAWVSLAQSLPKILGGYTPSIVMKRFGDDQSYTYSVRTDPPIEEHMADRLCAEIRSRSGDCLVTKAVVVDVPVGARAAYVNQAFGAG